MDLAENCEEDFEAAEYGCGENGIASNAHIEDACAFFLNGGVGRVFSQRNFFFLFLRWGGGVGGGRGGRRGARVGK